MPQSFVSLNYHIIFSTKERYPWLKQEMLPRLFKYIGGIIRNLDGSLLSAGGVADHVHLLASLSKTHAISNDVRDIKANSSRWIHETFPEWKGFAWQVGYGAFSTSFSQLENLKAYIADQEEHHRVRTFQEEFIAFLERHEIPYDERYIWD